MFPGRSDGPMPDVGPALGKYKPSSKQFNADLRQSSHLPPFQF